ncbi:MAG: hypothetical protein HY260_22735, partial [Chloroflexi bacterium]|nr:hypothetical protein [Chloroflexota bacterium]
MSAEVVTPSPDAEATAAKRRGLFDRIADAAEERQKKTEKSGRDRKNDILSRRSRWYNRLFRFARFIAPWALIAAIGYWAYTDEVVLGVVIAGVSFIGRL